MKWLKTKLDEMETREKMISFRNDIIEANKRVKLQKSNRQNEQ